VPLNAPACPLGARKRKETGSFSVKKGEKKNGKYDTYQYSKVVDMSILECGRQLDLF